MMYLNVLGQPILVINSLKTAFELLDRRANIYSDRPRVIVGHEILCGGLFFALIPYGDVFVLTFLLQPFIYLLFIAGVVIAAQHMKHSQSPLFVTITRLIAKRQSFLPLRFSTIPRL